MNEPEKFLTVLEPPLGGLTRLRARRDSQTRGWTPQWWALAAGATAAVVWTALLSGRTEIRMQLSGARLIGERSQGMSVPILEGGRARAVPSSDANVRIYWVEPAQPEPSTSRRSAAESK